MNNEEAIPHLRKTNIRMYKAYPSDQVVSAELLESFRAEMRKNGVPEKEIPSHLEKMLPNLKLGFWDIENNYPFLLPYKEYTLPAYDGTDTLAKHKDRFVKGKFDFKLYEFGLDRILQQPGPELKISLLVDRMGYNADFRGIFESLPVDYHQLVIPQNRICQILFSEDPEVRKIREALQMGNYWTNFLTTGEDPTIGDKNIFVFRVVKNNQGLCFDLDEFTREKTWIGGYQTRYIAVQP
jgi:hypothetical protein